MITFHNTSISQPLTNKGIILFVVIAMSFLATLDSSIVNIALPSMSKSLSVPLSSIEWVMVSYIMIICSTLLFFGRLGDMVGKTRIFHFGTLLFTIGTLLCGLCTSFFPLIICRFIQGIGASAYMANNNGIITQLYPVEGRGKALGILASAVALGTMIGSPLGGLIVSYFKWNYIFYIKVPIGILIYILGLIYLPKSTMIEQTRIDKAGFILQFLGTMFLFGALIKAQKTGLLNKYILSTIILSVFCILLFLYIESKQTQPLLDIRLFSNHLFSISLICALISFMCITSYTLLFPFYFQNALKLSPSASGLIMIVSPVIIALLSSFCGTLSDKVGAEKLTLVGLLIMSFSFFAMSFLNLHSPVTLSILLLAILAVGQSLFQPANNSLIMSACPKDKLGIGGSINSLVRNLGQYVGIVLSTTLLYFFMGNKLGHSVFDYVKGHDDIFIYGMKNVYLTLMILCIIGVLITGYRFIKSPKKSCK